MLRTVTLNLSIVDLRACVTSLNNNIGATPSEHGREYATSKAKTVTMSNMNLQNSVWMRKNCFLDLLQLTSHLSSPTDYTLERALS